MLSLGPLLLSVAENPALEQSAIQLIEGIANDLLSKSGLPPAVVTFGEEILANAQALVGAMVKNTPAANQVSPATQAAATQAVEAAKA